MKQQLYGPTLSCSPEGSGEESDEGKQEKSQSRDRKPSEAGGSEKEGNTHSVVAAPPNYKSSFKELSPVESKAANNTEKTGTEADNLNSTSAKSAKDDLKCKPLSF